MAQVVLSAVGTAFAGPLGGLAGGLLGGIADRALVSALTPPRQVGQRLSGLELHSTSVGAPMAAVFGRARVAAQTIWAARFKEHRVERSTGGGKGGGPSTVSYSYSLSFAVGLCEGPITGIGRVWADGAVMDLSAVAHRLHLGGPDQEPDALIEAVEGDAPAYRNTAYLVFEDLPLDTWGNRPPQLNVEVFHPPPDDTSLEARLTSVNLIPGAGEFVLATTPELRALGEAAWASENVNNAQGRPDLLVSLDQLQALLPKVDHVNLVVAWFGTDLRCGRCQVRPGVDSDPKVTSPDTWRVEVDRHGAHLISQHGGGAAYGGTPSDGSVLACIAELRRRGIAVTLYPFLMMDVPEGNALPDPYGGARQGAYPWRGRITGEVAPGRPGATDLTAAATAQVAAFFGSAAPGDFHADDGGVAYTGPAEWSWRRCVLHYARLAAASAGVEGFLIGSELRGLTSLRSAPGEYPAVEQLRRLAADAKAVLGPDVKVGYAGDWSEWFGHQPADGSGEVRFQLDPLWADPAIDFVGIDHYQPLADWRAGAGGLDAQAGAAGPHDPAYLQAGVLGGENADWFYASAADRAAQRRTPVTDGAGGEPWVYRSKDLRAWWSNPHHDRPGGVRSPSPTAWTPGMKPIRLIEFGCPAVDRGANAPNLFVDPKSSETGLPPASTGARDDTGQRRALEAVLAVYGPDSPDNPASPLDGRPMIERLSAWCWDARPYPDFPLRGGVWRDAPNWTLGHWLNGRVGQGDAYGLLRMILGRAGLGEDDFGVEGVTGRAYGYVVSGPLSTADALQPLTDALDFDAAEHGGRVALVGRTGASVTALGGDDLALPDDAPDPRKRQRTLAPTPDLVRVRFLDEADSYQAASVVRRAARPGGAGADGLDLPVVLDAEEAAAVADRRLARALVGQDGLTVSVAPAVALRVEPADVVTVEGAPGAWRVLRVDWDETPRLQLARADADEAAAASGAASAGDPRPEPVTVIHGPPALAVLDLPPLPGAEDDARPLAAVAASPWRAFDVSAGADASMLVGRGRASEPATMGLTASALPPGPLHRFDRATRLCVRPAAGALLTSRTPAEVLAGAGALAVRNAAGAWEVLQHTTAEPTGDGGYVLAGLLRGQLGTEDAMTGVAAGARFVVLGPELARLDASAGERGLPLLWRAAPAGGPSGGPASSDTTAAWRSQAWRPFAPARLRAVRIPGGARLSWVRRARVGGDSWAGEVPSDEPVERYRVTVLSGPAAGDHETTAPVLELSLPDLAAAPSPLPVRVAQWGALWGGWGGAAERTLLL